MPTTELGNHIYRLLYTPRFTLRQEHWAVPAQQAIDLLNDGLPFGHGELHFLRPEVLTATVDVTEAVTATGDRWTGTEAGGVWTATTLDLLRTFDLASFLDVQQAAPSVVAAQRAQEVVDWRDPRTGSACAACGYPTAVVGGLVQHLTRTGDVLGRQCWAASCAWGGRGGTRNSGRMLSLSQVGEL